MIRLFPNLPAYLQLAAMWPKTMYVYRANTAFNLLAILLQIYLLKAVWTAVYAGHAAQGGIRLHALITTLTLANLQLWVMFPFIADFLQERVRQGQVGLDLARPIGYVNQLLAQQAGATAGILPFVIVAVPLSLVFGGLQPPASPGAAALYLLGLVLAYMVTVLIGTLLGLLAFWTLEMAGFLLIYRFMSQFLSGALVPLAFFPPLLRGIASALPFQAQAALPVSLYLGDRQGIDALRALALQLFWVVALYALVRLVWRGAMRRVVVQGG